MLDNRNAALLDLAIAPIRAELDVVTDRILSKLSDPVAGMVVYLISAGGKRLRPLLTLAIAPLEPGYCSAM